MSAFPRLRRSQQEPAREPPLRAVPAESGSLAERYARMAHTGFEPRGVDIALRALDVVFAAVLLTVLAPAIGLVALGLAVTHGRPVLYRGLRVGRAGAIFTMFKFRTMRAGAESRLGPYLGPELEQRMEAELTPIGRALRRSYLDELPQLWNVLVGDMSIVGPRPIRPLFFEELCERIPQYWQRLVVRPGITGLAQLRMDREPSWHEKLAHDLEYIADRSISLYLRTVLATVRRVLGRAGSPLRRVR